MDRSQADPKLGEVRAVLQRLQTFSAEPDNAELQREAQSNTARIFRSIVASVTVTSVTRRAPAAIVLTIAGAFVLLGFAWLTLSPASRATPPTAATADAVVNSAAISPTDTSLNPPALPPSAPRATLDVAQALLAKGHVQAARKQLLGLVSEDTADVAWMLARSYDPKYLATMPVADAGPDIEQATRWYRAWHAAAVTQGMVPSSVSVERIIGSMR